MESMNKNNMIINQLEWHCSGINYPKSVSFFYIPYSETDYETVMINGEIFKQVDHTFSQDKPAGELFLKANLNSNDNINKIVEQNTVNESKYRRTIENPQEQHIGELFTYIAYSKKNNILREERYISNNQMSVNKYQQMNIEHNKVMELGEDIYSTVSDSVENLDEHVLSTGTKKIYSILNMNKNRNLYTKLTYPAILPYNTYIMTEKNSESTEDGIQNHSQRRYDPVNGDEITADDDESDYAEPYGNMYNNKRTSNQSASNDEPIYITINDFAENSKNTSNDIECESQSDDWINDTIAMLNSVANFYHADENDIGASANYEDKSYNNSPAIRISDIDSTKNQVSKCSNDINDTFNSRYNQIFTCSKDLNHTFIEENDKLLTSSCELQPAAPPLPPKNKLTHKEILSNEISDSIGRSTDQLPLENDDKITGREKMDEPTDKQVPKNPIYKSQNGSFTQLSSINEEILQAPARGGTPPPPKPPRQNDSESCINQSNSLALENSHRISRSLSHLPDDNNSKITDINTASKSVPRGALPLFPSERQQEVESYQSSYVAPKAESFFAKLKRPKRISLKKSSKSGEEMVIGQPYKFEHLNTGIDYLKNLEKENHSDHLDSLKYDDEYCSLSEEKLCDISRINEVSSNEKKICNHSKNTDILKNKNSKVESVISYKLLENKEISNERICFDLSENLSDDAKIENTKYS